MLLSVPESLLQLLRPLWDDARAAFLSDPTYAIEMAQAGSAQMVSEVVSTEVLEFSGV